MKAPLDVPPKQPLGSTAVVGATTTWMAEGGVVAAADRPKLRLVEGDGRPDDDPPVAAPTLRLVPAGR